MHIKSKNEIIIAVVFSALLLLFLNPFDFWMPSALTYMMSATLLLVFAVFCGFIWKEHQGDEREQMHKAFSGRIAYLVGTGVLVLGILFQAITSSVDPWIIGALGSMILAKILSLIYTESRF
jgi:hypothetical protein